MNRRQTLVSGALLALLARAQPTEATGSKLPKRMNMNTPYSIRSTVDVYLDGVLQVACCTEADAEAGYVIRYVRSKRTGKFVREGDEIKTERVEGKVQFAFKGEKPQ